jgi:hypothetical protein
MPMNRSVWQLTTRSGGIFQQNAFHCSKFEHAVLRATRQHAQDDWYTTVLQAEVVFRCSATRLSSSSDMTKNTRSAFVLESEALAVDGSNNYSSVPRSCEPKIVTNGSDALTPEWSSHWRSCRAGALDHHRRIPSARFHGYGTIGHSSRAIRTRSAPRFDFR